MFCPTCGDQIDRTLSLEGAKLCPKCGCVVEYDTAVAASPNKKQPLSNTENQKAVKICAALTIVFVLLGIFLGSIYLKDIYVVAPILMLVSAVITLLESKINNKNVMLISKLVPFLFFLIFSIISLINSYGNGYYSLEGRISLILDISFGILMILYIFKKKNVLGIAAVCSVIAAGLLDLLYLVYLVYLGVDLGLSGIIVLLSPYYIAFALTLYFSVLHDSKLENEGNGEKLPTYYSE